MQPLFFFGLQRTILRQFLADKKRKKVKNESH